MPLQLPSTPSPTTTYLHSRGKMPQHHSMDDLISLHCRIAALEIELRLTKEKLVDSRDGTLYLVDLVSRNHKRVLETNQDQEILTLRSQLDEALESNAQLKRLLATAEWTKEAIERDEESEEIVSELVVEGEDYVGDLLGSIPGDEEGQEISKIQNGSSCSVSEKGVHDGWARIQRQIDQKCVDVPKEPAIKRVRFLDHEHNRLAGSACFIQDLKDPVEYDEYWIDYANNHPDHTAEEWRQYYESQIRPSRFETGTAQPVHMHSYSKNDVKQYDIPNPVQQVQVSADSPLQHSKWSSPQQPISRWPAPQPRSPMRSPYAATTYLSYEVTHFPASKDTGFRRTVLVSNIPIGMILADVFAELSSDRILEAKFAGTAGMKTLPPIMTNAAIVEFLDNEDAQAYVEQYGKHGVFEVGLIASPTRPLRRRRVDSGYN